MLKTIPCGGGEGEEGDSNPSERRQDVAERSHPDAVAPGDDAGHRSTTSAEAKDPDDALRGAIKAALDFGDFVRVRALVDLLDPPKAPAVTLARPGHRQ